MEEIVFFNRDSFNLPTYLCKSIVFLVAVIKKKFDFITYVHYNNKK